MCGRYTLDINAARLASLFGLDEVLDELPPRFNIAPGQRISVVGLKPDGARRGLARLLWGLVPAWSADAKSGPKPINARAETLREKPMFRAAFATRRCVIPATGFYEWKTEGRRKQPYLIRPRDGEPMAFAGLWESWGRGAEKLATACIITTAANEQLRPLHERMPAMLTRESMATWLNPDAGLDEAEACLRPFADLEILPVGPAVNAVANDSPECIAPLTPDGSA